MLRNKKKKLKNYFFFSLKIFLLVNFILNQPIGKLRREWKREWEREKKKRENNIKLTNSMQIK